MSSATKIVPENSLAIITRVGVGKLAVMPFSYSTSQDFLSLSELKTDVVFSAYLLYKKLQSELNSVQGTSIKGITKDELLAKVVAVPERKEQEAIGNYFRNLDNLITLHQRKYDKLQNVKKSMLEKLFPKDGADVPEIRFEGFTGVWEQRKVGEVTAELTEYVTFESGFPLLTSSRTGLMRQNEYRGNLSTDNKSTLFSVVPFGACTYRHMSDDDIFHFNINEIVDNGLVSREYPVFVATGENNLYAIVQYLNSSPKFKAFCREQKMGGTRTRLYYKSLCKFEMLLPSGKEQRRIAAFLKGLDSLITLHQSELERLNSLKKTLLEKMFV
ncbi:hypothetical protein SDC9_106516 [bioreactor metagenome]|uniref:Type I restriction modification DNA specificity domain-containing protein n=1 Tax=bioreactor metagenome TaxID=1076179 RepID=A0A645B2I4_9ZZZZ